MFPFLFIILGSAITVIAGYFDYKQKLHDRDEQIKTEQKRTAEYEEIIKRNNKVMQKQQVVIDTTHKIIGLQNEVNNKNNIIQNLQDETIKNIIGDGSYPLLHIEPAVIAPDAVGYSLKLTNSSNYPMRGLRVIVQDSYSDIIKIIDKKEDSDLTKFTATRPYKGQQSFNDEETFLNKNIFIGGLSSKQESDFYIIRIPKKIRVFSFDVTVSWDYGYYFCTIEGENSDRKPLAHLKLAKTLDSRGNVIASSFVTIDEKFDPIKKGAQIILSVMPIDSTKNDSH